MSVPSFPIKETVPAFVKVASEIPGTFAVQLAYDNL